MWMKSKTKTAEPIRPKECTEIKKSMLEQSRINRAGPRCAVDRTDGKDPTDATSKIDAKDSNLAQPDAKGIKPMQADVCTNIEDSTCARSSTDSRKSKCARL